MNRRRIIYNIILTIFIYSKYINLIYNRKEKLKTFKSLWKNRWKTEQTGARINPNTTKASQFLNPGLSRKFCWSRAQKPARTLDNSNGKKLLPSPLYPGSRRRDKLHRQKLIHPCPLIKAASSSTALDKAVDVSARKKEPASRRRTSLHCRSLV